MWQDIAEKEYPENISEFMNVYREALLSSSLVELTITPQY
jgi:hypothetical protein